MLRADAPAFFPSIENCEVKEKASSHEQLHPRSSKKKKKRRGRRWKACSQRHRQKTNDTTCTTSTDATPSEPTLTEPIPVGSTAPELTASKPPEPTLTLPNQTASTTNTTASLSSITAIDSQDTFTSTLFTTNRDLQDSRSDTLNDEKKRKKAKRKKRKKRATRRCSLMKSDSEQVSQDAEPKVHPLTGDSLFPPLISESKNPAAAAAAATTTAQNYGVRSDRNWSHVAERAHVLEKEHERKTQAADALLSPGSVRLTPLMRFTTRSIPTVEELDHESDETNSGNSVPDLKLQHYVATDINKLRNRWWDLLREKRIKDSQERQPEEEDHIMLSSSSESIEETWEEVLVKTVFQASPAENVFCDPLVLESCLGSSFPLHRAVLENDEKMIRVLIRQSEVPRLQFFVKPWRLGISDSMRWRAVDAMSPLSLAVYVDKPQLVKLLYDSSPTCDQQGRTALMLAAEMGLEGCIKALLACGASLLDKDDIAGDTAIHYACRQGCTSAALRALLTWSSHGNLIKILSFRNSQGQTPLHLACEYGHVHVVDIFLSICTASLLSKLLRIQNDLNETPLLAAVRSESTNVVMSLLMWRGNDKVHADEFQNVHSSPLTWAASAGSMDMVLLLLEFMDASSYSLEGSLHAAVRSIADDRLEIIRVLVKAGANPCAPSPEEPQNANTALNIACAKGDVEGLTILLDSHHSHTTVKRLARRQDPKLRQLPESYFEGIETRENMELKVATTNALLQSLFLSYMDKEPTSCRAATAICLFHRGAKLNGADISTLKKSIECKQLLSAADAGVTEGAEWFVSTYHHFMAKDAKHSGALVGVHDRTPLRFWSQVLLSLPWMSKESDIQCPWIMVDMNNTNVGVAYNLALIGNRVVLLAEEERFLVDVSVVSRKSAKLAAAIRFERMNQKSQRPHQVRIGISAHLCRWLLQHIYHGSIISDWNPDPLKCASDLMELAIVAEEFLCPSLLRECEMRLLSDDPFRCFCWSCCSAVRNIEDTVEGEPTPRVQCLYGVQGPSRLLTAESALDALAVSQQLGNWGHSNDSSVKWWPPSHCPGCNDKSVNYGWKAFDWNYRSSAAPFAYVKDAAVETVLREFGSVSKSESFQSQLVYVVNDGPSNDSTTGQDRQAEEFLLQACLDELATSPRKRHSISHDLIFFDACHKNIVAVCGH